MPIFHIHIFKPPYLFFYCECNIAAITPMAKATVSHSSPEVTLFILKRSMTPLAAGIENTSKAANRLRNETPASRCFSLRCKDWTGLSYIIPFPIMLWDLPFLESPFLFMPHLLRPLPSLS